MVNVVPEHVPSPPASTPPVVHQPTPAALVPPRGLKKFQTGADSVRVAADSTRSAELGLGLGLAGLGAVLLAGLAVTSRRPKRGPHRGGMAKEGTR